MLTKCQLCALKTIIHLPPQLVWQNLHDRMWFQGSHQTMPPVFTSLGVTTLTEAEFGHVTSFGQQGVSKSNSVETWYILAHWSLLSWLYTMLQEPRHHAARQHKQPHRDTHVKENLEPQPQHRCQRTARTNCQDCEWRHFEPSRCHTVTPHKTELPSQCINRKKKIIYWICYYFNQWNFGMVCYSATDNQKYLEK